MNYKKTVNDIKDYIATEIACIDRILDTRIDIVHNQRVSLIAEKDALKDILGIIKDNEKDK